MIKNKKFVCGIFLVALATPFSAFAGVQGSCKVLRSKEIIRLYERDPELHFGLMAEGTSSLSDRIQVVQQPLNRVKIMLLGAKLSGGMSAVYPLGFDKPTRIQVTVALKRIHDGDPLADDELVCDLSVSRLSKQ